MTPGANRGFFGFAKSVSTHFKMCPVCGAIGFGWSLARGLIPGRLAGRLWGRMPTNAGRVGSVNNRANPTTPGAIGLGRSGLTGAAFARGWPGVGWVVWGQLAGAGWIGPRLVDRGGFVPGAVGRGGAIAPRTCQTGAKRAGFVMLSANKTGFKPTPTP
jgi:hypothetical protein